MYEDDPFPNATDEQRALLFPAITSGNKPEILRLAQTGMGCAMGFLGMAFRDGLCGFEQDEKQAKMWLDRGAKLNDASSLYVLGEMCAEKNTKLGAQEARLFWKRAAYHGHLVACYKYGVFLYAGLGGATNNVEARKLLERASKGGVREAWLHYSKLLSVGLGGPIDEESAQYWSDRTFRECREMFDDLESDLRDAVQMKQLTS